VGRRGPPKKPAAVKKRLGTYRECRDGGTIEATPGMPECPVWIDGDAIQFWNKAGKYLADLRIVAPVDQMAFALLCETFADYLRYRDKVKLEGEIVMSPNGMPCQNPFVALKNKSRQDLVKLVREFGMTPCARTGIKSSAAPVDDPLKEFGIAG